jgi:hypothetical protein
VTSSPEVTTTNQHQTLIPALQISGGLTDQFPAPISATSWLTFASTGDAQ